MRLAFAKQPESKSASRLFAFACLRLRTRGRLFPQLVLIKIGGLDDEIFQCLLVDRLTLVDIDGAPYVALEA
jgi:hypothetical protein